jgi:hypothetical protein
LRLDQYGHIKQISDHIKQLPLLIISSLNDVSGRHYWSFRVSPGSAGRDQLPAEAVRSSISEVEHSDLESRDGG